MAAYIVAMMTITDPETYRKYTDRSPPTVARHGGKFLTRGEPITSVLGEQYPGRMVILEFPDRAHAEAWLEDPEYKAITKYRDAACVMHRLMLQEGGANTADPDPKL